MISIDDFNEVKDFIYKDEHYSVRDNGAFMRHPREGKRIRKDDNVWTFGKPNVYLPAHPFYQFSLFPLSEN